MLCEHDFLQDGSFIPFFIEFFYLVYEDGGSGSRLERCLEPREIAKYLLSFFLSSLDSSLFRLGIHILCIRWTKEHYTNEESDSDDDWSIDTIDLIVHNIRIID
jgi:hypothetical protein